MDYGLWVRGESGIEMIEVLREMTRVRFLRHCIHDIKDKKEDGEIIPHTLLNRRRC